jgi:hypothetical protein
MIIHNSRLNYDGPNFQCFPAPFSLPTSCIFPSPNNPHYSLGRLVRDLHITHNYTQPAELLYNKRSARRTGRYLHSTEQTQETKMNALSRIRTRHPRNRRLHTYDLPWTANGIGISLLGVVHSFLRNPHVWLYWKVKDNFTTREGLGCSCK